MDIIKKLAKNVLPESFEKVRQMQNDVNSPVKLKCEHNYKCVYEGWESETYECEYCGHRYKLYDEDMK